MSIRRIMLSTVAVLLCVMCLVGCFRGVDEGSSAVESTHGETETVPSKQTESAEATSLAESTTEAVTEETAEAETETVAVPETEAPESEPAVVVPEPETDPIIITVAVPEIPEVPEVTETELVYVPEPTPEPTPSVDNGSVDGLTYINGILVVNKTYPLPADYNPGVDETAYAALMQMFSAASAEGLTLWVKSGFRSYNDQLWQYNLYAERDGVALADTYSARAGHSEHQSGLAFDLNSLYKSFGDTAEGIWLAANCYKYGFIIRYPAGKEHLTGYMYEPWHVRYVGVETATDIYSSGLCLEEYLGITSAYAE